MLYQCDVILVTEMLSALLAYSEDSGIML